MRRGAAERSELLSQVAHLLFYDGLPLCLSGKSWLGKVFCLDFVAASVFGEVFGGKDGMGLWVEGGRSGGLCHRSAYWSRRKGGR